MDIANKTKAENCDVRQATTSKLVYIPATRAISLDPFFQDPRKLVEPCIHTYMYMLEFLILEESVASSRVLPADEENRQGLL